MHGIERIRKLDGNLEGDNGVVGIMIHYTDGRVANFVPDARRSTFSEDDVMELVSALEKASSTSEWVELGDNPNLQI